jgi:hypothetical protein
LRPILSLSQVSQGDVYLKSVYLSLTRKENNHANLFMKKYWIDRIDGSDAGMKVYFVTRDPFKWEL